MRLLRQVAVCAKPSICFLLALALYTEWLALRTHSFQPKPRPQIKNASAVNDDTTSFSKLKNDNDAAATEANREAKKQIAENYGRLPLSFEANEGQIDPEVKFISRGAGYGPLPGLPPEAKQRLEFSCDFKGRGIQKKVFTWNPQSSTYELQSVRKFVNDEWNIVAELDVNNAVVKSFAWGQDLSGTLHGAGGVGGLLLINDGGQTYQAGYDGSGNLTSLIKAGTGQISASYEYDSFGQTLKSTVEYAENNSYRFSTKYEDSETGLLYYGYRYYQPQTGRWLGRDPLEEDGGTNLYGFVDNEQSAEIVTERWYGESIQAVVLVKRTDTRAGKTIYCLTNIKRADPAKNLFIVPDDYKVTNEFGREVPAARKTARK